MTKQELKNAIQAKGIMHTTKSQDPLWKEAFDLYNRTNRQSQRISCGACWNKVREWLLQG